MGEAAENEIVLVPISSPSLSDIRLHMHCMALLALRNTHQGMLGGVAHLALAEVAGVDLQGTGAGPIGIRVHQRVSHTGPLPAALAPPGPVCRRRRPDPGCSISCKVPGSSAPLRVQPKGCP